ncbi:ABC transporter ATP-binding protein [Paenibacillus sp. F411]|uniref:ABC transporter ATP-binding protein n=1 Tax=Paenibacillus sp. F411 TaxID=2820239 RepID=UPI001FBB4413|nr:ABC transporter ATP-binding protein [Paenibacillus sp. F411]
MLTLSHICKSYIHTSNPKSSLKVLEDITLEIQSGDYIAILGTSGVGKSTLLHIIGLLDKPDRGSIWLHDQAVDTLSNKEYTKVRNEMIGFVFQDFKLITDMTVFENVEIPLIYANKLNKHQRRQRIMDVLEQLQISDKERVFPSELSGGQKQRVAIARALVNKPKLLIADEPTGNLDSDITHEILELLQRLHQEEKLTLVIVTHDIEVAERANKVYRLSETGLNLL